MRFLPPLKDVLSGRRLGLRGQSIAFCVLLLAIGVLTLGAALIGRTYLGAMDQIRRHAVVYARAIGSSAELDLLLNDAKGLKHKTRAAASDEAILAAVMYGPSGKLLASFDRRDRAAKLNGIDPAACFGTPIDRRGTHITWAPGQLEVIVPVWPVPRDELDAGLGAELFPEDAEAAPEIDGRQPIGFVGLTYSLDRIYAELGEQVASSVFVSLVVILAGTLITILIVKQFLQPVQDLVATTSAISDGDLSRRAREDAVGEVSALARAFNHMADSLAKYTEGLENQVRERTAELQQQKEALQAEVAIRQRSEQQLLRIRKAVDGASDAILIGQSDGRFIYYNRAFHELFGFTCEQLDEVGGLSAIIEDATQARHILASCKEGISWNAESATRTRDGRHIPALIRADAIRNEDQTFVGFLLTFTDITVRKQAEEQLRRAKESAEEANRLKSEFLANMSHEIRTPMTAVLGFSEALSDDQLPADERAEVVATIRRNGEHLLEIINDILDLSKIEAGRFEVERVTCSPCQIVAEVASLMRPRAQDRGLTFDVQYAGAIPTVIQSDPVRIKQALINLVGNAIKFTQTGGITVRAGLNGTQENPQFLVEVVDTGIGISSDRLDTIMQAFKQADTSTTRTYGGTGLGLTITKRLAELLGGSLKVSSTVGQGSCFSLRVAAGSLEGVRLTEHPVEEAASRREAEQSPTSETLTARILLVEDGPDNQRLISYVLRKAGAQVDLAENGQLGMDQALAAWREGTPYDVVLMDMQMPVMDGYEATRRMREAGYDRPIVALTAHAMAHDRNRCVDAGCDDYTTKPIDRTQLLEILRTRLQAGAGQGLSAPAG